MKMIHITIWTSDMEKSLKFYQEVVGLTIYEDLRAVTPADHQVVFLAGDEESTKIELIGGSQNHYTGSGLSMGFRVDNINAMFEKMKTLGVNATDIEKPNPAVQCFFVTDPNGVTIQFVQD